MPKIREITFPDGVTRKVEELNFEIIKEDWNEYQLESGVYVKLKAIAQRFFWVLDDSGSRAYSMEGDPQILVVSNNQVVASE